MTVRVLVLGYPNDPQICHQLERLRAAGADAHLVDPDLSTHRFVSWDSGAIELADIDGRAFGAVLTRSTPAESVSATSFGPDALRWGDWFELDCLHRCAFDTWMGMLMALERESIPMFNAASAMLASRRKPAQLDLLRRAGCPVPRTLITNDPERARRFIDQNSASIVKPVIGGALTRDASALSDDDLAGLRLAPAMFQERIFGEDLRVMVLDGEVISSVAIGVPSGVIDFRGDEGYASGQIGYSDAPLPEPVALACGRAARALGLRFGGIDIKRTAGGDHVFLEMNSSPIYLDVEEKMGHPITDRLCQRIIESAAPALRRPGR